MAVTQAPEREARPVAADNITETLPQLLRALRATSYGEVKVVMERGRVVQIIRTEKLLVP